MPGLSKSRYMAGMQCDKRLYWDRHAPQLATPPDPATRAILSMGTEVGQLARDRFPGGRLVKAGPRQIPQVLETTATLLADEDVPAIFEAALLAHDVLIRADILVRQRSEDGTAAGWQLIEVKASTRKKDVHLEDLALQAYVLREAGLAAVHYALMYVNTRYAYPGGPIDLAQLFSIQDVSQEVAERLPLVPDRVSRMHVLLNRPDAPAVEPGPHCHTPHACPYWEACTKDKPKRWLHFLPGETRGLQPLIDQGIETTDRLPPGTTLTPIQTRVRDAVEWRSAGLDARLRQVSYPVHHLDFETIMPPVPRFPHTRPYQVVPVQWSNHIQSECGDVIHHEYLSLGQEDPRPELLERLLASLGEQGTICVYSSSEQSILEGLAEQFPPYRSALTAIRKRLWDLYALLQAHYYHPAFAGSYRMKSVLPALVPWLSYDDLEIRDGASAARAYVRMVYEVQDWVERDRLAMALKAYCARDTQAMLELRRALASRPA